MSTVTVCDRCGKQVAPRATVRVSVTSHRLGVAPTAHDLCAVCADAFDRFLVLGGRTLAREQGPDREA